MAKVIVIGAGLHKEKWRDPDAGRAPRPGEGEAVRDLFASPMRWKPATSLC